MSEDEPSIETLMLTRFLECARPAEILRWHKAELEKVIALAKEAAIEEERLRLVKATIEIEQSSHMAGTTVCLMNLFRSVITERA